MFKITKTKASTAQQATYIHKSIVMSSNTSESVLNPSLSILHNVDRDGFIAKLSKKFNVHVLATVSHNLKHKPRESRNGKLRKMRMKTATSIRDTLMASLC